MLNTSLNSCKYVQINKIYNMKNMNFIRKTMLLPRQYSCLCNHIYLKRISQRHDLLMYTSRVHSTQSDQHRQKVVIETTTPKIAIEKIRVKALPVEKEVVDRKTFLWDRIDPYVKLARLDKPIGIYLLYWPCAWSIALASLPGTVPLQTSLQTAALFLGGAAVMRAAGCTLNDLWDRDIDHQVERTKDRPLVSGAISPKQAVVFLAAQLSVALGILLQLNCYSVALGASSMALVITYPLAKRFTNYPQVFLGATFNWGALLGYSAIQGDINPYVCIPLYAAAMCWTVIYDTIYAYQDRADDARIGIKSMALTLGGRARPVLGGVLGVGAASLLGVGAAAGLGAPYYGCVALYVLHMGRQIYTLQPENVSDCGDKFRSNSTVGLIILLGILGGGYSQYVVNRRANKGKEDLTVTKSCFFS